VGPGPSPIGVEADWPAGRAEARAGGEDDVLGGLDARAGGEDDVLGGLDARAGGEDDVLGGLDARAGGEDDVLGGLDARAGDSSKRSGVARNSVPRRLDRGLRVRRPTNGSSADARSCALANLFWGSL
jgi:hypothetical protein